MNVKIILFGTLLALVSIASYRCFKNTSREKDAQTLVVGTAAAYAPFVSINAHGEYEGFDIDVAHALADRLGKKLILKDLGSMASLFTALDQHSIDAIIWGLSITEDRLKKVAMVHYQGSATTSYPLIFWQSIPDGVRTINNMTNKTVCVEPGSSQETVLNKYASITKLPTEKVDDALLNIQYGKANAALVEPAIAQKFKNKYPEIQTINVPLAYEDQVQGVGIVVRKKNSALTKEIEEAVQYLKESGVIAQLEKKWGIS